MTSLSELQTMVEDDPSFAVLLRELGSLPSNDWDCMSKVCNLVFERNEHGPPRYGDKEWTGAWIDIAVAASQSLCEEEPRRDTRMPW